MEMTVEKDVLEREIQQVFKALPKICCDTASLFYIIDTLDKRFEEDFGCKISLDY